MKQPRDDAPQPQRHSWRTLQASKSYPPLLVRGSDFGAAKRKSMLAGALVLGAEFSPFAHAIAMPIRHTVRLSQLLARRDEGPDSDVESDEDGEDTDTDDTPPPLPSHPELSSESPHSAIHQGHASPMARCPAPSPPSQETWQRPCHPPSDREQRRVASGSRLKPVTRLRIRNAKPIEVHFTLDDLGAPVASSGWQAVRQDEHDARAYWLQELLDLDPEMWVYDWQGCIYASSPSKLTPDYHPHRPAPPRLRRQLEKDVATMAAKEMATAAIEIYTEPKWRRKASLAGAVPRCGPHAAKSVGASMGGGQTHPQNLAHGVRNLAIFARLFGVKSIERIVGWTNMLFMAFAPDLHEFYRVTLNDLLSVFATATFNFGPATVTLPHLNFRNLAWGWCAITALGNFNPDRGSHLVLWDLKMIIRLPPALRSSSPQQYFAIPTSRYFRTRRGSHSHSSPQRGYSAGCTTALGRTRTWTLKNHVERGA
ncbi:hypothetical protein B0H13DRAFT_2369971 [Mycena leptocephala]|nr:hypothetical protein B0H13DRAFT_2369971 [Mycena leptocephala]